MVKNKAKILLLNWSASGIGCRIYMCAWPSLIRYQTSEVRVIKIHSQLNVVEFEFELRHISFTYLFVFIFNLLMIVCYLYYLLIACSLALRPAQCSRSGMSSSACEFHAHILVVMACCLAKRHSWLTLFHIYLANVNSCLCSLYVVVRPSVCLSSVCLSVVCLSVCRL